MKNPEVTVVMAIYKPKIEWLKKQLESINCQTYKNVKVLAWNDCPGDNFDYNSFFSKYLKNFPYKVIRGEKNLGSTKAFEKLTSLTDSKYIAYCDQDDIWHSDKIEKLVSLLEKNHGTLACSDMRVINGNGATIAHKITEVRPRQTFVEGDRQVETLLVRNFVTGCTMIADTILAKKAIPFPSQMVHDHWLALWNSINGKIIICKESLIDYRIHGDNQTLILAGVTTKRDYVNKKCIPYLQRMQAINCRFESSRYTNEFTRKLRWAQLRANYLENPGIINFIKLATVIGNNVSRTGFDLLVPILPTFLFNCIIKKIRNNG
jgi:glycosyltransferase involved in cell wall biosynthesis